MLRFVDHVCKMSDEAQLVTTLRQLRYGARLVRVEPAGR